MQQKQKKAHQALNVAILGTGDRGSIYARFLQASGAQIAALVDQDPRRSRHLQESLKPDSRIYSDWNALLNNGEDLSLDAVVIALPDHLHMAPAIEFSRKGISVLLEKPVGLTISELNRMESHIRFLRTQGIPAIIMVCHVLRYSDFFGKIQRLIANGSIGEVRSIFHAENVSYFHFAHSYVRGNWANSKKSSPVLLAKCSHDFDLLGWFAGTDFESVQCSGDRSSFLPEKAPEGATERCLDGCPHQNCLFHAGSTYLDGLPMKRELARSRGWLSWLAKIALLFPWLFRKLSLLQPWPYWPTSTIVSGKVTEASVNEALKTGSYGRCVYTAGSDQPDHADTVIRFRNGITAIMRLNGNSFQEARTIRIDGSQGTLEGRFGQGGDLILRRHDSPGRKRIPVKADLAGHLAEDRALSRAFMQTMQGLVQSAPNSAHQKDLLIRADATLHQVIEGHRMALLADKSRTTGRAIFR